MKLPMLSKLPAGATVFCVLCFQSVTSGAAEVDLGVQATSGGAITQSDQSDDKEKAQAFERTLLNATELLDANHPLAAYQLLAPLDFEYSGTIRFDYLLGIAALDSGFPDKATLAFERVLAVDENFAGARLDLARAYYQLGDLARARTEFDAVLKQNPPEAARITIQKYLDAIQANEQAQKTRITAYIEETLGRDSNINGATSQAQIVVPAFGNLMFTLDQGSLKTPSYYANIAGGAEVNHAANENWGLYAGADLRGRINSGRQQFNSLDLAAHGGVSYAFSSEVIRFGFIGDQYRLGANVKPNRNTMGLTTEWRHSLSPSNQVTFFAQLTQNRFVDSSTKVQDHDLSLLGSSWMHVLGNGKSVVYGSIFGGREAEVAPKTLLNPSGGRPDGNKAMSGMRVGAQFAMNETLDCFLGVGVQRGQYDKENQTFLAQRSDTSSDMSAGLIWHVNKKWSVRPQIALSRNQSNIPIYSYDRSDASVMMRHEFN